MKRSIALIPMAVAFLCAGRFAYTETPTSLEKIPIYKGITLESEERAPTGGDLISGVSRTYTVTAPIEDVVAFYEKQLGITKRFEDAQDQNELKVGQAVKPTIQVYHWNDEEFIDANWGKDGVSEKGWIKKELVKRPKDKENKWIDSANSEWYYRDSKTTMTTLHIMFQDLSIDEEAHTYSIKTEVIIEVTNYNYELE